MECFYSKLIFPIKDLVKLKNKTIWKYFSTVPKLSEHNIHGIKYAYMADRFECDLFESTIKCILDNYKGYPLSLVLDYRNLVLACSLLSSNSNDKTIDLLVCNFIFMTTYRLKCNVDYNVFNADFVCKSIDEGIIRNTKLMIEYYNKFDDEKLRQIKNL